MLIYFYVYHSDMIYEPKYHFGIDMIFKMPSTVVGKRGALKAKAI